MPGYELMGREEHEAVSEIFQDGGGVLFAHGHDKSRGGRYRVRELESAVSDRFSVGYCQAVSSGTAALYIALKAVGVKRGDEVITSSFTFVATAEAILELGAIPVFTEIDSSLNMDPDDLKRKITNKTKAVVPVHMSGVVSDMKRILEITRTRGIPVVEDSAQTIGVKSLGKWVGTIGNVGCFSLDFNKMITCGEGGLVVTNDRSHYEFAREFHDHGHQYVQGVGRADDLCRMGGFNFRMTEMQGAVAKVQLGKLSSLVEMHQRNKRFIKERLGGQNLEWRQIPESEGDCGDSLIFFLSTPMGAKRFAERLYQAGLSTKNLPDAMKWHFAGKWEHLFSEIRTNFSGELSWPKSQLLLERAVALPIRAVMSEDEMQEIADVVIEICREVV